MQDIKEMTMDEAFDRLSGLLNDMENGEHTLEETFSLYGEGLKLVQYCNDKIDTMEKKLIVLEENGETDQ